MCIVDFSTRTNANKKRELLRSSLTIKKPKKLNPLNYFFFEKKYPTEIPNTLLRKVLDEILLRFVIPFK